jgi:ketosteroid isomerase-like protein
MSGSNRSGGGAMSSVESQEFEVEQANERFYRAFESLDIQQMEEVWAVNATVKCIHPGWDVRSGWPAVRDSWVLIFNHTTEMRFEVTDVDIAVNGDMAWVTCVEQVKTRVGGEPHASRILATNLFVKHPTGWKMIHHHGSPIFSGAG